MANSHNLRNEFWGKIQIIRKHFPRVHSRTARRGVKTNPSEVSGVEILVAISIVVTLVIAWISSDCFESFSPLSNVVTEEVITTRSNRMKFRLHWWKINNPNEVILFTHCSPMSLVWVLKSLMSLFLNAPRCCRKLSENSLSLLEF